MTAPGPNVIAGRYEIIEEIGRGGMGVVWRARDRRIDRVVAIKQLRLSGETPRQEDRVLREVRIAGRLNDPALVTVHDVLTEADSTFIVMELVEAPTLSQLVRAGGPLSGPRIASIGLQLLSALSVAHRAGVVHRDVKPGNILVAANGKVKLADFGIAQVTDDTHLTTNGALVGSPSFVAPERIEGREALPASDLWSLGASLYFAAEGHGAFERPTTAAVLHAIMHELPRLDRATGPLASAIMGLLITTPEARLTETQTRELLSRAAAEPSGPASPSAPVPVWRDEGPTETHGRTAAKGRRWYRIAGTVLAALVLLAGGLFLGRATVDTRGTALPAPVPADPAQLPTLTYGTGGELPTFARSDGEGDRYCLGQPVNPGIAVTERTWISCNDPHVAEQYAEYYGGGNANSTSAPLADYPGTERLRAIAEPLCVAMFHSNLLSEDDRQNLRFRVLVPTRQAWTDTSAQPYLVRLSYCMTFRADGAPVPDRLAHNNR